MKKKIWMTSDPHFCHNREFLYAPRGFSNVYEMNEAIVERWNSVVGIDDDVYCLGDIMLNDNEQGIKLLKSLKGNIHIVLGNHDTDTRIDLYSNCWNVVEIELAIKMKYKGYHFFLSHYPCMTSNFDDDKPLKQRLISLCGHTHTKDPLLHWIDHPIFHCELDTNNCYPWNLDEIIKNIEIL